MTVKQQGGRQGQKVGAEGWERFPDGAESTA